MYLNWLSTDLACLKIWTPFPVLHKLDVVAHAYNISAGKVEAGGSEVLVHLWIHSNLRTVWAIWGPVSNIEPNKQTKPTVTEASLMPKFQSQSWATHLDQVLSLQNFCLVVSYLHSFYSQSLNVELKLLSSNFHKELCNCISMCSKMLWKFQWMAKR